MDIVTQLLILYVLSMGIILWLHVLAMERDRKEREALYNRLMSRDYREYVTTKQNSSSLKPYVNPIQKSIADAKKSRYDDEDDDFE